MGVYQIFALLVALLPARTFGGDAGTSTAPASKRAWAAYVAAAAVVSTFVVYLRLFERAVAEIRSASTLAMLPLRFIDVIGHESARPATADLLLVVAFAEAAALGLFLFHLGALAARARAITVGLVAASLAVAALTTTAADSADPYFYAGLAMLGAQAYAPPAVPFSGEFHAINTIWGTPMFASSYGPLWIVLSAAVVAPFTTLGAKLWAFKVLGLFSLFACAWLARRLGAAPEVVAGIACNPALFLAYVANAHNDLFGVALVLGAMLAARRRLWLSFAFALAAGLVKPTLAPVALVALAAVPSLRTRLAFALALAGAIVAAYLFDGGLMLHALFRTVSAFSRPMNASDLVFRVALVAVALASSGWTVISGRVRAQTAWAPPAFGDAALPSYSVWGFPLALGSAPVALVYLVSLPALSFFQCTALPVTQASDLAGEGFILLTVVAIAWRLRPAGRGQEGLEAGRYF